MSTAPILPVTQASQAPDQDVSPDKVIPSAAAVPATSPIDVSQAPPSVSNLDRSSLPGGDPNAPKTPQPGTQAAADQHHGVLGEIFQTLAGGKKKEWIQTEKGPVAQYRDLAPGEMARGILAAAITGLAGGYDPANRGKGPAMASAFSGGFNANKERVEKQAGKEEKEAQEQFHNEGIAEERALQLHRDAREQMKSISDLTASFQKEQIDKIQIAKGNFDLKKAAREDQEGAEKERLLFEDHVNHDTLIKNPATESGAFHSAEEANDFAHRNPNQAIRPGKFDTQIVQDPTTKDVYIFRKPWNFDTKQYLGVEMESDGITPKKKDGQMIIDKAHPYLDDNGKAILPPGQMTEREFRDQNMKSLDAQAKRELEAATAAQRLEASYRYDKMVKEDKEHQLAMDHWQAADGDVTKLDAQGTPIVTQKDLWVLDKEFSARKDQAIATYSAAIKEMGMYPVGSEDYKNAQAVRDQATAVMSQHQNMALALEGHRDAEKLLIQNMRDKHTTDVAKGTVDLDAAEKDMKLVPEPLRNKVLGELKKTTTPAASAAAPPAKGYKLKPVERGSFPSALTGGPLGSLTAKIPGLSGDQSNKVFSDLDAMKALPERLDYIGKLSISDDEKTKLRNAAGGSEKEATAEPVNMLAPDGTIRQVPPTDVDKYLNQGLTIAR